MKELPLNQFARVYESAVDDVLAFWNPAMQAEVAVHNPGWAEGSMDFEQYLRRSIIRYHIAYEALARRGVTSVCDVGGLWGVFPVTLKRLGCGRVGMTETLRFYSDAFAPLFAHIAAEGVEVEDYDPFGPELPRRSGFAAVTAMAVLEHYPSSPRRFMANARELVEPAGLVYLEVPNIASWPKRSAFLRGRSPLVPAREIWSAAEPFIGHTHEYTRRELEDVCRLAGLEVLERHAYDYSEYSPRASSRLARAARHPVSSIASALFPDTREVLSALCRVAGPIV